MFSDINFIKTLAKRTLANLLKQIKETNYVVIPFVVLGILNTPVLSTVTMMVFVCAMVAYEEYKRTQEESKPVLQKEEKDESDSAE